MSRGMGLFRSLLSVSFGNGYLQACGLLTNIVLVRLLTMDQYGGFALIQSTVALAAAVFSSGFSLATTRTVASVAGQADKVAGLIKYLYRITTVLSVTGGVVMAVLSPLLARWVFKYPELTLPLAFSSALVFANVLNGIQIGGLQGLQAFGVLNRANLFRGTVQLVVTSAGAWMYELSGAMAGYSLSGLIACAVNGYQLARLLPRGTIAAATHEEVRQSGFYGFVKSVMGSQLTNVPIPWLINLMVLGGGGGLKEVGYLNICRQVLQMAIFLPDVLSQIALPRLTNAHAQRQPTEFRSTLWMTSLVQVGSALIMGLGIGLAARPIVGFFRLESGSGETLLWLTALQAVLTALSVPYGSILWATGQTRIAFVFAVGRALVSLGFIWLFRNGGAAGVLTGLCATLGVQFVCVIIPFSWRYYARSDPVDANAISGLEHGGRPVAEAGGRKA